MNTKQNGDRSTQQRPLVVIIGATASGKSEAAAMAAKHLGGEVINADSRLFYKGMEIGTAWPSTETLNSIPHHMIGFLSPGDSYSLAQFLRSASETIDELHTRKILPIMAGGTGQYVRGLLEGWRVPQVPPNAALRKQLEDELREHGVDVLYQRLRSLDPQIAAKIDGKNHRRVIRAIERVESGVSGDRVAEDPGYDSLMIGLYVAREELHRRIVARVDRMLAEGWVDEVGRLMEMGTDFSSPALSAIGYRELASVVHGELSLEEARERTIRATNRLVRHQNNWFKADDPRISWIDVTDGRLEPVVNAVEKWTIGIEHESTGTGE